MKKRKYIFYHINIKAFLTLLWGVGFILLNADAWAQDKDSIRQEFILKLEIRPRAEFKNNYRSSANGNYDPEFFITQRNRLEISYRYKNTLFHMSPQEIHRWNMAGELSSIGNINAFELYLEQHLSKHLSFRLGRQGILLDNGRLFSDAPWAQQGRSHEGFRLFYKSNNFNSDITLATTRAYSDQYDPSFSPVASHSYKLLVVHHFNVILNNQFSATALNYIDFFENPMVGQEDYYSMTNGGRINYQHTFFHLTFSGSFQWGKNSEAKSIRAYYLQPEVKTAIKKTTFRLGAEILSGQNSMQSGNQTNTFEINYGVAWRFMGNMNFFTRFPRDVGGSGLMAPYFFIIQELNKNLTIRADGHLFYTQHGMVDPVRGIAGRYLGFENDWRVDYQHSQNISIRFGISYLAASPNMEWLRRTESNGGLPLWSYFMISVNPELLQWRK